ncbi:hypothetical protein BB560_000245 [Smittium megazygosporum]|uniref:Uncharacterized protein n=1 Tax=Smittium megazygosporum TaxID=133381 RepID=A0A2T9ZKU9_9FUNG|nr:hypothetical protein BB560_000245 [Smittium megazygosporum]
MVSNFKEQEQENKVSLNAVNINLSGAEALGLACFGLAASQAGLLNLYYLGKDLTQNINPMSGQAFFLGGFGLATAGIVSFLRNDTFAATAFTSFGLNWMSRGFTSFIYDIFFIYFGTSKRLPRASNPELGIVSLTWSFYLVILLLARVRANLSPFLMLFFLNLNFHFYTVGIWLNSRPLQILSAFSGVLAGIVALYNSASSLFESDTALFKLSKGPKPFEHKN